MRKRRRHFRNENGRITVPYACEDHDDSGNWFRAYGNENGEFAPDGLMQRWFARINEHPIRQAERTFRWPPVDRLVNQSTQSLLQPGENGMCCDNIRTRGCRDGVQRGLQQLQGL